MPFTFTAEANRKNKELERNSIDVFFTLMHKYHGVKESNQTIYIDETFLCPSLKTEMKDIKRK